MGGNGSIIDLRDLETAMMRPRLKKYAQDLEEEFNLFKPKRERFRKSEYQRLMDAVKANLHPALWKIS